MARRQSAPQTNLIVVNEAASIRPFASDIGHRIEFAANASIAIPVRNIIFIEAV
jgi:hypothetical protein